VTAIDPGGLRLVMAPERQAEEAQVADTVSDIEQREETVPASRRGRRAGWSALVVAVLVVVWFVIAAVLLLSARSHLTSAEQALPTARAAVGDGDLDGAFEALDTLSTHTRAASNELDNPLVVPLRFVPVFGADLRATTAVAHAGRDVSAATEGLVDALSSLPGGVAALGPSDGRLPVDTYRALAPQLGDLAGAISAARDDLVTTPTSGRVEAVTSARERALDELGPLATTASEAAELADVIPGFLGADGPRRYLFGASTPAEQRGTGGFIGSVSILTVDDGFLEFGPFTASTDLPKLAPDTFPTPGGDDAHRFLRYGGTGVWSNLNRTVDFPTAAAAMERFWHATSDVAVDGIIVADPFALATLLELAGPVEDPRFGTFDADTVVDYVTNEAYAEFTDADERKEVLGAAAAAAFGGFLAAGSDAEGTLDLIGRLGDLIAGGNLLMHSADDDVQAALVLAGAAGELGEVDGDLVNVVTNSGSANKIDYYVDRRVEHRVTLLEDGATRNELEVTLANQAPTSGPPSYVIGPNNPSLDAGDLLSSVTVYASPGARFTSAPPASEDLPAFTETELGRSVHEGWTRLASGEQTTRAYTWVTPDAWELTDDGLLRYELLFQGQTTIRPTEVALRITLPEGLVPVEVPDGVVVEDGALAWTGEVRGEDVRLPVVLERADEETGP
jgi:hypothetical protein